ncbi:MAG: sugar phosphate isomerase/epimerase [Lentisphaerae bacterium]|jgi:sugar phosphate isomerase/epimerase|nr:sugar phosphate isomerase/epimerase [Lentisphaerota bacterium]
MKLAIATDYKGSLGCPEDSLERIAGAGFTHLHWCHQWNTDHFYTDMEIAKIARILKNTGLVLLDIHGSDGSAGGSICTWYSTDETYRRNGVDLVMNRLRMMAMLQAEGTLMMHLPYIAEDTGEQQQANVMRQVDALRRSLDEILPSSRALGFPIALENFSGDTFKVTSLLFDEYPPDAVGLCYDSGHGNIDHKGQQAKGMEHLEKFLDRLQALHLHDNDGSGDQHQPPRYGTIDWERLMKNIGRSSYSRVISFEMSMAHTPFKDDPDAFLADARKRCLEVARLAGI